MRSKEWEEEDEQVKKKMKIMSRKWGRKGRSIDVTLSCLVLSSFHFAFFR